jgi:hypothetical protein
MVLPEWKLGLKIFVGVSGSTNHRARLQSKGNRRKENKQKKGNYLITGGSDIDKADTLHIRTQATKDYF